MNRELQQKINRLKKLAQSSKSTNAATQHNEPAAVKDLLATSIRSKQDAIMFMAELNAAFEIAEMK